MISLVRGLRRHYDNYCGNSTSVYPRSASLSLPSGSISNSAFAAAALFMSKWHLNRPVSSNDFTPPISSLTSLCIVFFLLGINIEKQQTRAQKPKENRFAPLPSWSTSRTFPMPWFLLWCGREEKKRFPFFFGAFALKHPPQRGWDVLHQMISSPTHTANAQWTRRREVNLVFLSRGGWYRDVAGCMQEKWSLYSELAFESERKQGEPKKAHATCEWKWWLR